MASSVSVRVPSYGYTYTFSGVISVKHELSLKLQTDSDSSSGSDYINGARNQANKVVLEVIESDVGHAAGWSVRIMQAMESLKRNRILCDVYTSAFVYSGMLLTSFEATEDETSQSGWQGTLTFTQYVPVSSSSTEKTNDNSSTTTHTGVNGSTITIELTDLEYLLKLAGLA